MEKIVRACGHEAEFVPHGDAFDEARRHKLRNRNCPECGAIRNAEHNARQKVDRPIGRIQKGNEPKLVPVGTVIVLRKTDAGWAAEGEYGDLKVQTESAGAMGILAKVCRKLLAASGQKLSGKVKD